MTQMIGLRCCEMTLEESILYLRFNEEEIGLEDVEEIYQKGLEISNGRPFGILADIRNNPASTPEARAFGASKGDSEFRRADAILVNSPMTKLIANFYIRFNKPKIPTRMFQSEEKAIEWLRNILNTKA